jgi:hypothetical protein
VHCVRPPFIRSELAGKFNNIYNLLVEDENDFLGIMAYSVYKRHKTEFITNFIKEKGKDPASEDMAPFYDISRNPSQLARYKSQAMDLTQEFVSNALAEEIEATEKLLRAEYHAKLEGVRPKFWTGVWQSVIGAVFFVIFLGFLVILSWSVDQGPKQVIESIFKVEITPRKPPASTPITSSSNQEVGTR